MAHVDWEGILMARIRSIHPGLFTDEAFMSASPHARLLVIGLWGEAFDDGVFEWKPLTIKARLFPADSIDVGALLQEIEDLGFIRPFTAGGKKLGAIRNFRKFQRPKKPNSSEMLPDDLLSYVGITQDSSEPVPNQCGTGSEKPPQMEDGGCNSEADASAADAAPDAYPIDPVERLWSEGLDILKTSGLTDKTARPNIGRWLSTSRNDAGRVLDAIRRARDMGSKDPIPLVTRILNPSLSGGANAGKARTVHDAAIALAEWVRDEDERGQRPMLQIGSG